MAEQPNRPDLRLRSIGPRVRFLNDEAINADHPRTARNQADEATEKGTHWMNPTDIDDQSQPDRESDRQSDAMKDQLRKDVASWSAARSGDTSALPSRTVASVAERPTSGPAPRATRQKAKPVEAAKSVSTEKKPFRMSYDGTTDRDYIAQRIKLGAR
jgi:hypothetical protein